jgi:hypothetical protein
MINVDENPIITKNTIMIDKHSQDIIIACKKGGNHIDNLRQCVANITGLLLEHVDYGAMYHWIKETYRQLGKVNLLITVLDNVFSPSGMYTAIYKDMNFHERFLSMMCSELCVLQINETDKQGRFVALIDLSKAERN